MKSGDLTYEILSMRDFGIGMLRRNVKVQLSENRPSEDKLREIAEIIWREHDQDVAELTTVFYLPGMDPKSVAYAFGGCMKGKECYLDFECAVPLQKTTKQSNSGEES